MIYLLFNSISCIFVASHGLILYFNLLRFYWILGHDLVTLKAEERWGAGIIERISLDFKEAFPRQRGFSRTNLWYMKKWYAFYAQSDTILHQAGGELEDLLAL